MTNSLAGANAPRQSRVSGVTFPPETRPGARSPGRLLERATPWPAPCLAALDRIRASNDEYPFWNSF